MPTCLTFQNNFFPFIHRGQCSVVFFLWGWNHSEYTHSKQIFSHYYRKIVVDQYYLDNFCDQVCTKLETRECNLQRCPINCLLGDYGPWSACDPCVEKQVGDPWAPSGNLNHNKRFGWPDRINNHRNTQFPQFLKIHHSSFHWGKIPFSNLSKEILPPVLILFLLSSGFHCLFPLRAQKAKAGARKWGFQSKI